LATRPFLQLYPTQARGRASVSAAERRVAEWLIAGSLLYGAAVMAWSGLSVEALAPVMLSFLLLATLTACGTGYAHAFVMKLTGREDEDAASARRFWLAVAALVTGLTIPFFGVFKQLILPQHPFAWDHLLAAAGRTLLMGGSPWRTVHWLFGSVWGTIFLDNIYGAWMVLLYAFPMLAMVLIEDARTRCRLLVSWLLAWILIGSAAAWIFSSAGPCYYNELIGDDRSFALLHARLLELGRQAQGLGVTIKSLQFQPALLEAFRRGEYAPAGGISAMPSMHVAMATLFAIGGFKVARWLGMLMSAYAFLVWIASIFFGWHYAVDGPVAVLLMVGVWKLSARVVPKT
jgi:hypothetical protein